jgi:hypothetical protein
MNPNTSKIRNKNTTGYLLAFLIGALMLISTICVALTFTPTFVGALENPPSPTIQALSWSVAVIAKPTYTPSPIPTFTVTPINLTNNEPLTANTPLVIEPVGEPQTSTGGIQTNSGGKSILVSISEQHLYAYDNGQLVYSFIASTGMGNSTRIGTFTVLDKIPNAYGATWNIWMPDWLGIYWSGSLENGIHALPILPDGNQLWSGFLGSPISFGCVVLNVDDAEQLYNWADIGTPVEIQW